MADDIDFMKIIGDIGTLVGLGTSLEGIFGGEQTLTIDNIKQAVLQEMQTALRQQASETDIDAAADALQAAQDFLSEDYLTAQKTESKTDLWSLLDASSTSPGLNSLLEHAHTLENWMDKSDPRTVAKAIPLCLAIYLYMSLYHRERAAVANDPGTQVAELLDMRQKARDGLSRVKYRAVALFETRLNDVTYLSNDDPSIYGHRHTPDGVESRRLSRMCTIDSIHDAWFEGDGQNWLFAFKDGDDPSMDYAAALHWVLRATRNLLWSGSQTDADDLWSSLTDGWLRTPGSVSDHWDSDAYVDDYRGLTYTDTWNFGKWAQNVRNLLAQLDAIAFGFPGGGQDDWSWCSSCGGLYYSGAPSRCPASDGPHVHNTPTANYVLRCNPASAPARYMSDNWHWCHKCSGLFKGWGAQICPAGGAHDPSGSGAYLLDVAPVPAADAGGLDTVQDNWRWCGKCSALHFGSGASVCPVGGAHDSTGSEDYWLGFIGQIPQPA